jgi:glycosyltransferase involved in cell wall biosynthesis
MQVPMNKTVKISLVTSCKGRLSYLRESILSWLNLDYDDYEILVVDYDCPDGTEDYINSHRQAYLKDSRVREVRVVKIDNKPYFNLNDARNIGTDAANGELIFIIDADVHIRNKGLLNKIHQNYNSGVVFFCNPAVLTTNSIEGLDFYKYKYGVDIPFHAFLPCHSKDSGLTGTACFVKNIYETCGKYDPEINRLGWGSDDIEFYLRYLNHYFYHMFLPSLRKSSHSQGSTPNRRISRHLDDAFQSMIRPFPSHTFKLYENTDAEKTKNYPSTKQESSNKNKEYIRRFFSLAVAETQGFIMRSDSDRTVSFLPKSILDYNRFLKFPLPDWFQYWYCHWLGVARYNDGDFQKSIKAFKRVLGIPGVPIYYQWHSLFFIALMGKLQNRRGWQRDYKRAWHWSKKQAFKSHLERYNIASFLKSFAEYKEASVIFQCLIDEPELDEHLRAGVLFHLGEMAYQTGDTFRAQELLRQVLSLNPHHGKAAEYLEQMPHVR